VLVNLPGTTSADDSDEYAKHVTSVDRSSADDELRLNCVFGFDDENKRCCSAFRNGFFFTSDVPAANIQHLEYQHIKQR